MIRAAAPASLGSEFDTFLFAPIWDGGGWDGGGWDGGGHMPLTVLSALARLDVDPWDEAAKLARLPAEAAARNLVCLIEALPDAPAIRPDLPANAARLIALLPRPDGQIEERIVTAGGKPHPKATARVILINVVLIGLAMGIHGFMAWHNQPQHPGFDPAPSADTVLPQAEPPIAGQ